MNVEYILLESPSIISRIHLLIHILLIQQEVTGKSVRHFGKVIFVNAEPSLPRRRTRTFLFETTPPSVVT